MKLIRFECITIETLLHQIHATWVKMSVASLFSADFPVGPRPQAVSDTNSYTWKVVLNRSCNDSEIYGIADNIKCTSIMLEEGIKECLISFGRFK